MINKSILNQHLIAVCIPTSLDLLTLLCPSLSSFFVLCACSDTELVITNESRECSPSNTSAVYVGREGHYIHYSTFRGNRGLFNDLSILALKNGVSQEAVLFPSILSVSGILQKCQPLTVAEINRDIMHPHPGDSHQDHISTHWGGVDPRHCITCVCR